LATAFAVTCVFVFSSNITFDFGWLVWAGNVRLPFVRPSPLATISFLVFGTFLVFGAFLFSYRLLLLGIRSPAYAGALHINDGEVLWLAQVVLWAPVPFLAIRSIDSGEMATYQALSAQERCELARRASDALEWEIRSQAREARSSIDLGFVGEYAWTYILEPPLRMIWMAFMLFHLVAIFWIIQGLIACLAAWRFRLWICEQETCKWTRPTGCFVSGALALYAFFYLWAQPPLLL